MATSSAFSTTNQYIKYSIDVTQNWQDTVNNYSRVTIRVYFWRTNTGYNTYGTGKCWVRFDGTWYGQDITSSQKINEYGIYLFERSFDIYHNGDGSKSIYVEAYINHDRVESNVQGFTVNLSTIPRKTSIVSVSGTTIGGNMTVDIDKKSSSFTSRVYIHVPGHDWYYITESSSDPISFTIPNGLANQIANATGITARLIIRTMNGDTIIGDSEYSFWLQVPSWMTPNISNIQLNTTEYINEQWLFVKDKSKLRVTTTASGTYGSSIIEYKVTYDGVDYLGSDIYTSVQRNSGTRTINVIVKDSRGRTASWSGNIQVQPYQAPWGSLSAYRCNEYGQRNDTEGTYIKVTFNGDRSSVNGANTFALAIDHRETGKEWSSNDVWYSSPVGYASEILGQPGALYDIDKTYEVRLKVSDWYTTTYYTVPISTANVLMDFRRGGTGLGIGRICTQDDTVQTNREVQIFAGRGGNTNLGADLSFMNVGKTSQKIGINGGTPESDNLLSIHRFTSDDVGDNGSLLNIDRWNNVYHRFNSNYFLGHIRFYGDEKQIKLDGYTGYNFWGTWGYGMYDQTAGGVLSYSYEDQTLRFKPGYTTISDERVKYNIDEFSNWDDFYSFYMSLKPKTFKYNNDLKERTHIGLIAQDVADSVVDNGLMNESLALVRVTENDAMEDGREYTLAYQELISLNIKMIQKHEAEILELKSIITQQQELIDKISGGV